MSQYSQTWLDIHEEERKKYCQENKKSKCKNKNTLQTGVTRLNVNIVAYSAVQQHAKPKKIKSCVTKYFFSMFPDRTIGYC